jgi:hypothetical protein
MKTPHLYVLLILAGLAAPSSQAGSFLGTNSPGQGTNFTFTIPSGVTNLSLVVSNDATAYSWLFLQSNGVPTTNNYEFTSRLVGLTNQINLEAPEFATGEYGLLVYTPSNSTAQAFNVLLTSNLSNLRTASYPVSKPLVFSTTGSLTNSGAGAWQYFQVDVPSNLLTGWRVVLSSTNATPPGLYINQGQLPTTGSYVMESTGQSVETITFNSTQATAGTYFIGVYLPSGAASSANYVLGAELASLTTLTWDPGTTQAGTQVYSNRSTTGGDYFFAITTETTANGVWRNALNVQSGQASLYLLEGSLPSTTSYDYASTLAGSNGFVLATGYQFSPGQNWYLLVHATPDAQWNLVTGQAYVQQLPPLAASGSGTNAIMGAEGMAFFQTTITSNTLAWQLGLNGLNNPVLVKSTLAPVPYNTATYDLIQDGQMLVVPSYLNIGSQYFIGVVGSPGLNFTLDSCQQPVTTIPFNYTNTFSVTNYGYATFLVQVPVQQIAWQINVTPITNDAYVAVNLDAVPNEFVNLAFSEAPDDLEDSITLVPSTLANGSFYVTVYGTPPYTCTLFNGNPVITTVDYLFSITNDAPKRVGWRFYQVLNTNNEQVDSLGWELDLANAPAGAEIAIRRNAVPGAWEYRNDPYDYYGYSTLGYSDLSSTLGYLQQPNHPADVWYIGVYSPAAALSSFVLTGSDLTGAPVGFDTATNVANITNQPADKWDYFVVTVPTNALGWDLRLTNVTGGSPQMYVCLDQLPSSSPAGGVNSYWDSWPSGYQWNVSGDWTGYPYDPNGQNETGWVVAWGMGNPLQAGTYYVGVYNNSSTPASYSLASRGIGTGFSIPVTPLAFSNGVITNTSLAARQAAYYSVVVPSNMPSWRVELDTNIGDVALVINETALPDSNPYGYPPWDVYGGFEMNKVGDQQYLMMPVSGLTNIYAGTYYLAVVSEGVNPGGSTIGSNSSSYILGSYGSLNITNMGTVDPTGVTDLLETNGLSKSGQICAYSFAVPSNTLSLEIFLTSTAGSPYMTLLTGNQLPSAGDGYGNSGGHGDTWASYSLINIASPAVTNYTLLVQAVQGGGDAGYTVRVHAIGPQPVAFDGAGNTWAITNQGADLWQYFIINVPGNALGWDLRLTNVTYSNGQYPQMYVCRDTVPSSSPAGGVNSYWDSWPSGYQWNVSGDWTGYPYDPNGQNETGWVVAWGMGNPLQAGTYYVGVYNNSSTPASYSLASRGIGTGFSIPVTPLAFSNGVISNTSGLNPRQADYYSVVVPANTPSWKVRLTDVSGETALVINETALPDSNPYGYPPWDVYGGYELNKLGNEQYLMLPINAQSYSNYVVAGTYYLAVIGQGVNPSGSTIGSNSSFYTLNSFGAQGITNLGTVSTTDILQTNAIQGGENALYQFTIPPGLPAVEVRLDNVTASPVMTMQTGTNIVQPYNGYGYSGGVGYPWASYTLITLPNPTATNYSLTVQAAYNSTAGAYLNADFTVHIRQMPTPAVAFDPSLNSGSLSNTASGALLDGESAFYEVIVPATNVDGSPVIGWTLILSQTLGTSSVRVRPGLLPDNNGGDGTSPFSTGEAIIVPAYLTPGIWYVEVRASGATDYTLTSASLRLNRPAWTMQPVGGTVTTPGLPSSGPLFADTGVGTNGIASTNQGQGSYLAEGNFDYYEIIVPTNNTGVLRTRLDAISGNPNLYIRAGAPPTLSHGVNGGGGTLYDRSLTASSGSEYGNWVPLNGQYQATLTSGPWYLAVQAGGGSDISYRLRMDTGSISNLSLNGGSFSSNSLTAGDWVYFSSYIPTNAPVNWNVTFAVQLGSVVLHVRDTSPPGQATTTTDLRDWNNDDKNEGPYPSFSTPGSYTLTTPPLRTGVTYYLGFEATADAIFSVSCTTNGGLINVTNTIPFDGGSISSAVPGYGILQYLISVPPTATRLLFNASNSTALSFYMEQGTVLATSQAQWYSSSANVSFNQLLYTNSNWPWLPGYSYYLTITNTTSTAANFSFTMGLPADLAPFSFTAPTNVTALKPNPVVQAIWGVSNEGPATASGNWYDTVWFSTDGMLDASSINIGNFWLYNQNVPAGGTYWQTNTVTLPMSASGNYTLFLQVDTGDNIYEASLSDKIPAPVSGTFTLTPPDLKPVSVVAPATVTATNSDPSIQVAWSVTNQGIGAATGGWYDRVWFSTDGELDASSTDIGDFYVNQTVPAGGGYSLTNTVTLPVVLGGTYPYTLFVQVNVYGASYLYESDYTNNISAGVPGMLTLDLPPQIVTQPVSRQIVAPGSEVTFSVSATGTPLLSYLWWFDNAKLTAATSATLVLTNVQPANQGSYVVVVSNAFGAVTSSVANLFVATNCVNPPSGLVAWWPGQSNADDVVGGHDGVLQNGAAYEPGMVGTAFSFGGSTEAVLIPYSSNLNLSALSAWTIEAWVNPASFNNSSYPTIFAQGHWDASLGLNSGTGALESWINNASQLIGTTAVPLGQWSHVALVYNGTNRIFYLNGVSAGQGSAPAMTAETDTSSIGNVVPNDGASFNGGIDEVSIYSRALSSNEIAEIYLAGSYGKCGSWSSPQLLPDGFATNGGFKLYVYGTIGQTYTLEASTNLTNWLPLLTFVCTNSPTLVVDSAAGNFNHRFYRLAQGNLLSSITLGFGSARPLTTNGLYLMLQGSVGPNYEIDASSNLINWAPITNFGIINSPFYFTDKSATNYTWRFYRATIP